MIREAERGEADDRKGAPWTGLVGSGLTPATVGAFPQRPKYSEESPHFRPETTGPCGVKFPADATASDEKAEGVVA